ncbi:S-adenosyl-L-methionine-dependent methyltransferase [Rhizoclosmatium globosum]|uniref:S-adenosyl-L-methionine-dependent methyltransferase n=1 Tax=Rhizoclosmatium globosum TaxID=329046 RepID=A0A1Y2CLX2_9FUNG|nr:S-adenosyl-L-methionine-dependent methyltransferase [Rhizoclosmatium globosum]|eukprot:ORY47355.1 S-adenosyl-L-methionine-dependent methyltransferase [Rhizoclosmatium globosum]
MNQDKANLKWQQLLVDGLVRILSCSVAPPPSATAERVLTATLRLGQSVLGLANDERRTIARRLFGTASLRSRLKHILATCLSVHSLEPLDSLSENHAAIALKFDVASCVWPSERTFLPTWLSETIIASFPTTIEQDAFADALNHPPAPVFRANLFKTTRLRVTGQSKPEIRNNPFNKDGCFEVQDEGSQCQSGMVVIDLCCGRGGKALHLLDLMRGILVCHDVDPKTLMQAKTRIEKQNTHSTGLQIMYICSNSEVVNGGRGGDMSSSSTGTYTGTTTESLASLNIPDILAATNGALADVVLVDAPCSSLGTLRRGPNVRWEIDPTSLSIFPPLQKSILQQAIQLVKPGGALVYATCTFNHAECSEVTNWFNQEYGESFSPGYLYDVFGEELTSALLPGLPNEETKTVSSIRLLPNIHGTDAFYISRWIRKK